MSKKSKRCLLSVLLLACATGVQAEIIIQGSVTGATPLQSKTMPGILFVSSGEMNQASYSALRASTWRNKRNVSEATIFATGIAGQASAASPNQANVRRHVARAQAYRMDYFK